MEDHCRIPSDEEIRLLSYLLAYQYGIEALHALEIYPKSSLRICISKNTGRIRKLMLSTGEILFTLRASDYFIIPHITFAYRLKELLPFPRYRVVVTNEMIEDIIKGWTVFSKHILFADENIRAGDEVLVVSEDDKLIAVGRALLSYDEFITANYGPAISIRDKVRNYEEAI